MIYVSFLFKIFISFLIDFYIPTSISDALLSLLEIFVVYWIIKKLIKNHNKKISTGKLLGILSIVLGSLILFVGIILGIVGLSIKKPKNQKKIITTLNIIGIVLSVVSIGFLLPYYLIKTFLVFYFIMKLIKNNDKKIYVGKALGVLSIIFGSIIPISGIILGIIGLSIKKSKNQKKIITTLNIIGIVLSIIIGLLSIVI